MILDPTELTKTRLEEGDLGMPLGERTVRQMFEASPLWQKPLVVLFLRVLPTS
jgi:hypothetical protein